MKAEFTFRLVRLIAFALGLLLKFKLFNEVNELEVDDDDEVTVVKGIAFTLPVTLAPPRLAALALFVLLLLTSVLATFVLN